MSNYSNLSFNQIIEKIKKTRYYDLPKMIYEAFKKVENQSAGITEAPIDGESYVRKDGEWEILSTIGGGVQSVSGDFVSNSDPENPTISIPNASNAGRGTMSVTDFKKLNNIQNAVDDAQALSLGVAIGEFYHTNGTLKLNLGQI